MTLADFENLYRRDSDPWGYRSSEYEASKYAATLAACGPGPFDSALELGASIGVFTAKLAPRCRQLTTVDGASTAVAAAREALQAMPQVRVLHGAIPDAIPELRFDLIVASEILYYLGEPTLTATLAQLRGALSPGARLVAVHWRPAGPDRPFTAAEVHRRLRALDWLTKVDEHSTAEYLLDVFERSIGAVRPYENSGSTCSE
jgi:SAM-dependent methyltransferase